MKAEGRGGGTVLRHPEITVLNAADGASCRILSGEADRRIRVLAARARSARYPANRLPVIRSL